jgi:hypothetical protein
VECATGDQLQTEMLARAKNYGEAVEQIRALGDSAMANAAALVPTGVLTDDIDERGGDASTLREVFAASAIQEPVQPAPALFLGYSMENYSQFLVFKPRLFAFSVTARLM